MQINDIFEVKTEKMLYEGKALARIDNFPVFIENACTDDVLKIRITKVNKNYAEGLTEEIIKPSSYRVTPICSLHNVCGSCNWQYMEYGRQTEEKRNIVAETIKHITGDDIEINKTVQSPKISEYRCKVQYPVSQTKVSKRILAGYYKKNSHELINVKYCPMQDKKISEILERIREEAQKLNISAYDEKKHKGLLRHIIFRESSDFKNILIVFVINSLIIPREINKLAKITSKEFPEICGICANFNTKRTNVITGETTKILTGNDFYFENLSGTKYKISANSFFQVNPYCAELIFNAVKDFVTDNFKTKPDILDAYSGVSSFGIKLSPVANKVVCVEEVKQATDNAKENMILNNVNNMEILTGDAAENFAKLVQNNVKFDICLTDPPRKGCSEEAINNLVKLSKDYIVYVSCNVSTLARDMKKLKEYGFETVSVTPFDMFPNTYHIETMAIFKRNKKEAP